MKIGMLSQWFDPEPGPAALPGVLAREFQAAGHEVSVLTGFPNYPDGRIYPGYRQRVGRASLVGGLSVTRVPLIPNHNSSSLGRVLNYASFAASATVFGGAGLGDVDAVWVYNSPATVSAPLFAHTRLGRVPYFLHVQDLWPDSLIESGMFPRGAIGNVAEKVINRIVRLTERHATVIGVISPSVRELILARNMRIDPSKIVYVPNPTDEALFRPLGEMRDEIRHSKSQGRFIVMYVGAVGDVQGLSCLLDCAEILLKRTEIAIHVIGDGIARQRLEDDARARRLINVHFLGRIPKEAVPEAMAGADVQLVSLAGSAFLRHTTPSKISSLLASEVPIIGQIAGDGAKLLNESGAAIVVTPGRADELAAAVVTMSCKSQDERQAMASKGRAFYEANLSSRVAAQKIVEALSTG